MIRNHKWRTHHRSEGICCGVWGISDLAWCLCARCSSNGCTLGQRWCKPRRMPHPSPRTWTSCASSSGGHHRSSSQTQGSTTACRGKRSEVKWWKDAPTFAKTIAHSSTWTVLSCAATREQSEDKFIWLTNDFLPSRGYTYWSLWLPSIVDFSGTLLNRLSRIHLLQQQYWTWSKIS